MIQLAQAATMFSTVLFSTVFAAKKPDFDENTVTPGVIGFVVTFLIMAVVVLLVIDMVRRVRRTQYRAEIGERLDAEEAALADHQGDQANGSSEGRSDEA